MDVHVRSSISMSARAAAGLSPSIVIMLEGAVNAAPREREPRLASPPASTTSAPRPAAEGRVRRRLSRAGPAVTVAPGVDLAIRATAGPDTGGARPAVLPHGLAGTHRTGAPGC
jgi:hypothetical protein